MFTLDLYRFCESRKSFTRAELTAYISDHRECDRFARHSAIKTRNFAIIAAKEFIARHCTNGYLDLNRGFCSVRNKSKRPFSFEFMAFNGAGDSYVKLLANVGEMSDDELFG